jgi:hypothetical protein
VGVLHYGLGEAFHFDDRLLTHMKLAIVTKLRRNESFTLSWERAAADGSGRSTLWINAAIPLQFEFSSPRSSTDLNKQWVEELLASANSTGGMMPVPEPASREAPGTTP